MDQFKHYKTSTYSKAASAALLVRSLSLLLALLLRNTARGGAVVKERASQHVRRTLAATAQPALGGGNGERARLQEGVRNLLEPVGWTDEHDGGAAADHQAHRPRLVQQAVGVGRVLQARRAGSAERERERTTQIESGAARRAARLEVLVRLVQHQVEQRVVPLEHTHHLRREPNHRAG